MFGDVGMEEKRFPQIRSATVKFREVGKVEVEDIDREKNIPLFDSGGYCISCGNPICSSKEQSYQGYDFAPIIEYMIKMKKTEHNDTMRCRGWEKINFNEPIRCNNSIKYKIVLKFVGIY